MRHSWLGLTFILASLLFTAGCGLLGKPPEKTAIPELSAAAHPTELQTEIRDNCASLLYDLLGDEKNLSKLSIIKHESEDLHALVKRISASSRRGAEQLEQLAKADPTVHLQATLLPPGETATRKAITETTTHQLLHSRGAEFELQLLLSQIQALNYGAQLAKVAAQNETRPESARVFFGIQKELERLYQQVCDKLRREDSGASADSRGNKTSV